MAFSALVAETDSAPGRATPTAEQPLRTLHNSAWHQRAVKLSSSKTEITESHVCTSDPRGLQLGASALAELLPREDDLRAFVGS